MVSPTKKEVGNRTGWGLLVERTSWKVRHHLLA